MSPTTTTGYAHRVTLRNDRPHALDVYAEPWGDHFTAPPGAAFDVAARSPLEGALEVSVDEDKQVRRSLRVRLRCHPEPKGKELTR